ncbi:hypothetical protein [Haloarcula salinisoli]|uniref:Uncharacterized protein n=1 Tax=Haloarcula salinisoli TaxID=2487746 RepID=A0A8J7YG21_9EURY|nr:hypothetical protein [Halomicroarcula salinisoli]MBX0305355.1 hypothetical protein [Halomicroarcula salinisoli]
MSTTVRFARLSFETKLQHFTDDLEEIERRKQNLLEVIDYDTNLTRLLEDTDGEGYINRGEWNYAGVGTDEYLIYGKLGKHTGREDKVLDEETKDYVETEMETADVSFFLIDVRTSVMAYEYRRNVGPKAPYRVLEYAFNSLHEGVETLEIAPLIDKEKFMEKLDAITEVASIRFTSLHPTNPRSTAGSDKMDEFLEEGGIENLTLRADGGDDGIILENVPLFDSGLNLAQEGYGTARVIGKEADGEEVDVRSENVPIRVRREINNKTEARKQALKTEIDNALARLEQNIE